MGGRRLSDVTEELQSELRVLEVSEGAVVAHSLLITELYCLVEASAELLRHPQATATVPRE